MEPGLFFILSIGINILIVHYLIRYYYHPDKITGPSGLQGEKGERGPKGENGPKGETWRLESCNDTVNILKQIKDVLAPRGNINQECVSRIWNENGPTFVNVVGRSDAGNRFLSNFQ